MNQQSEIEQTEYVKRWCQKNGFWIVLVFILVIVTSVGWRYWQQAQENNLVNAATKYETVFAESMENSDSTLVEANTKDLLENYSKTPYASLAALRLAKQAVNRNNLKEAENKLMWVVDHEKSRNLRIVALTRLARVLVTVDQAPRALQILDENQNTAYQPLILEEKGDIFRYLGKIPDALKNYLEAEKLFSERAIDNPLLSMKIQALMQLN